MSKKSDKTERIGVNAVESIVLKELGWIFREQPTSDYGIDCHTEITEDNPTGRLIALQIKSGKSYLIEKTKTGFIFRGEPRHLDYWRRHSLPVIVVLYDPATEKAYWQAVTLKTVTALKKGWKIEVPFDQMLGKKSAQALSELAEGPDNLRRLNALALAKPWMELLQKGEELFLEADEWVNKSMGRGSLKLRARDSSGKERDVKDWPFVMFPGMPYVGVFPHIFPWANISVDEEFYAEYDEGYYDNECGVWDNEDGRYIMHTEDFNEWRGALMPIRPYEIYSGKWPNFGCG